jgi:acetylornithine deacetylase
MSSNESSAVLDSITPDKLIELAGELIKIPSFRREETPIAQWLAEYFGARGYEVDLQEIDPGRFQTIATLKGSGGGKSLMFNGHIDIDALSLGWQRDPWTPSLEGDLLYGAGIANMKAGQSSMINAAEAIRTSGAEHKGDIIIACVAGHGDGGYGTVYMLNQGVRADMAVVPEPYGDRTLLTTHSGALQLALSTIGYAQHSSRRKYGIDALTHMRKVISKLQQMSFTCTPRDDMPELPILNVGGIIGGKGRDHKLTIPGFCADYCTVLVDVRYLPGQTPDSIRADIVAALEELKADEPKLKYEIELPADPRYKLLRVPFTPTEIPVTEYIVQSVARHVQDVIGVPPDSIGAAGPKSYTGNDTCHLWPAGIPCVLYGPGWIPGINNSADEPDDSTSVTEMVNVAKVLALTALDVCNIPAGSVV